MASALAVWGMARAHGGRVLLRLEDHDRTRCRPDFEKAILEDLDWLGFTPDAPAVRQSERQDRYEAALRALEARSLVYPCGCSRKSIEARGVSPAGERLYPGTCRDAAVDGAVEKARRVRLERESVSFEDLRLGPFDQVPAEQSGDVLARDRHGNWTYQFAVVIDDLEQGVDLVIRGEDLLPSTGRQIQLARLLGRERDAAFLHHPLILRPDGQKLSKSSGDTGVRELRAAGWTVEHVLGQAAAALGLTEGRPSTLPELVARIREAA